MNKEERTAQLDRIYHDFHLTGKVCLMSDDRFMSADLSSLCSQPLGGLHYDLGILPDNEYTLCKNGIISIEEFVQKLVCAEVIRYLKERIEELEKKNG